MSNLFLTPEELAELTGRKRRDAQVPVLRFMGITHKIRPDGSVAVLRSHVEKLLGGSVQESKIEEPEPDWSAI